MGTGRVVVADGNALYRRGVVMLLQRKGIDVVGEASDSPSTVALVRQAAPEVLVADLDLADGPDPQVVGDVVEAAPGTRVAVLTSSDDPALLAEAARLGADVWLSKQADTARVAEVVAALAEGSVVVDPVVAGALLAQSTEGGRQPSDQTAALAELAAGGHPDPMLAHRAVASARSRGALAQDQLTHGASTQG